MQPSRGQQTQLIEKGITHPQVICQGCSFPLIDQFAVCPNCSSHNNFKKNPPSTSGTRSYEPLSFESYDELFEEEEILEETVELFDLHSQHFDEHLDKKVYEALSNQKISTPSLLNRAFIPQLIQTQEPPIEAPILEPTLKIVSKESPPPSLQIASPLEHLTSEQLKEVLYHAKTDYLPLENPSLSEPEEEELPLTSNTEVLSPESTRSTPLPNQRTPEYLPVKVTPSLAPLKPMELMKQDALESEPLAIGTVEDWTLPEEPSNSNTLPKALPDVSEKRFLSKKKGFSSPALIAHSLEPQKTLEAFHHSNAGTIFFQQNVFTSGTSASLSSLSKEKNSSEAKDSPYKNFMKQPLLVKALVGISWGGVLYGLYCILHQQMFQAFLLGQASILAFAALKILHYFKRLESQLTVSHSFDNIAPPNKNESKASTWETASPPTRQPVESTQATGLQIKKQLPAINFLD
ncbi:MAG: hypothetical protein K2X66_03165 [Cyanobacteria bacterium]|nr:hypothetical protein [Cyanobacteriota bacterium]